MLARKDEQDGVTELKVRERETERQKTWQFKSSPRPSYTPSINP